MNARSQSEAYNGPGDTQDFRIGDVTVYPNRGEVHGPFGQRHLEPKVMALLLTLVERPLEAISRMTLLDTVWPDVVVCDQVLTRCVSALRRALDDPVKQPRFIQTISKKGYRLLTPVESLAPEAIPTEVSVRISDSDASVDAVVVLPIQLLTPDDRHAFMGVGVARDLTQLLSMIPGLRVLASSSAEQLARETTDVVPSARQRGAGYVVSGALEMRERAFRLRLELIDTHTLEQRWARRYDDVLGELYAVQDDMVQQIARSLATALNLGRVQRIHSRGDFDMTAYEHIQLAEDARRNYNREAAAFVVTNLEAALQIQPKNAVAHALLAMQLAQNLVSRWAQDEARTRARAAHHLAWAVRLAPGDSRVLMASGIAALMQGNHERAMAQLKLSLEKNPNEPHTLAEFGMVRYFVTRELEPSIAMIEQAELAAPDHPRYSIWAYRRGICYYEAGRHPEAMAAYDQAIERTPTYHHIYLTKALAALCTGDVDAASSAIRMGLRYAPPLSCGSYLAGVEAFGLTVPAELKQTFEARWHAVAAQDR